MSMAVKFDDNDNHDNEDICKSNIKQLLPCSPAKLMRQLRLA